VPRTSLRHFLLFLMIPRQAAKEPFAPTAPVTQVSQTTLGAQDKRMRE